VQTYNGKILLEKGLSRSVIISIIGEDVNSLSFIENKNMTWRLAVTLLDG
jgi:hypothetical protein